MSWQNYTKVEYEIYKLLYDLIMHDEYPESFFDKKAKLERLATFFNSEEIQLILSISEEIFNKMKVNWEERMSVICPRMPNGEVYSYNNIFNKYISQYKE